jgi:hypothetical protein
MAKKDIAPPGPAKVTQLPLPISDSPLVIDLPDGQKLVIGKMAEGSVIEVATWRGTGRPDSRTSRLMLGMSQGKLADEEQLAEGKKSAPKKPEGYKKYLYMATMILKQVFVQVKKIKLPKSLSLPIKGITGGRKNKKSFARKPGELSATGSDNSVTLDSKFVSADTSPAATTKPVTKFSSSSASESQESIDQWLDQIMKKSQASSKSAVKKAVKPAAVAKSGSTAKKKSPTSKKSR